MQWPPGDSSEGIRLQMSHLLRYHVIMRTDINNSHEKPDPEIIAVFGEARLVKILGKQKRLEVHGGTAEKQRQAWDWVERFLTDPS